VDQQISEATRSGNAGIRHRGGRPEPPLAPHLTALADSGPRAQPVAAPSSNSDDLRVAPPFAAPGMVLVAALSIATGYHWLHVLPDGSFRPTALLFALTAPPATFTLTRHVDARHVPGPRIVARLSAGMGLVLGLMVALDHNSTLSRVLGVTSLVLAVALAYLAFASERRRLPSAHND
jgi:hypothetical protein